jgi:ferredoxin like protein
MTVETAVRVEDKLFHNRYLVDAGRAHIKVRPHTVPSAALLTMLKVCPARCYELNAQGQVEITPDGCVECGTCRIICEPSGDIEWSYPRGGYGVLFKFG